MESSAAFYARIETLSPAEQTNEYDKRQEAMELYKQQTGQQEKQQRYVKEMLSDPLYQKMMLENIMEKEKIDETIEKLKTKLIVANGQYKETHAVDTASEEFMLAKWEADKRACLASWDKSIQSQLDQIQQMKRSFEDKLRAIESNLEGTRNSRDKKEAYYNSRIKSVQDRIEITLNGAKTPAIIKMELELQELESKREEYSRKISS